MAPCWTAAPLRAHDDGAASGNKSIMTNYLFPIDVSNKHRRSHLFPSCAPAPQGPRICCTASPSESPPVLCLPRCMSVRLLLNLSVQGLNVHPDAPKRCVQVSSRSHVKLRLSPGRAVSRIPHPISLYLAFKTVSSRRGSWFGTPEPTNRPMM
jgi:hypothetical protein